MKNKVFNSTLAASLALLVIITTPAFGVTSTIPNGDFQSGADGATSISGWTAVNSRVDLGVDEIAGCRAEDTSNYSNLRDYLFQAAEDTYSRASTNETRVSSDPLGTYTYRNYRDRTTSEPILVDGKPIGRERFTPDNGDDDIDKLFIQLTNVNPKERVLEEDFTPAQRQAVQALIGDLGDPAIANDSRNLTLSTPVYEVKLRSNSNVNDVNYLANFAWASQFVELYSSMSASGAGSEGYVVHGPAIYSDVFTAKTIDDLSFKFAASDQEDDFKVFGYLLNTVTCAQTEIVDSTGESSSWQTVTTAVPANGTYRFVFVAGTYDQSWGTVAGARMFVDDVVLSPNQERVAEAQALADSVATPAPASNSIPAATPAATPAAKPVATLAATGANVEWLPVVGLLAVIAGSGFLAASRRRRI
jgi:LPXTG-motif cell wall-anchored protein